MATIPCLARASRKKWDGHTSQEAQQRDGTLDLLTIVIFLLVVSKDNLKADTSKPFVFVVIFMFIFIFKTLGG